MRCFVAKPGDWTRIIVYKADWCGACEEQVPKILELARLNGFEVEVLDVDSKDPNVSGRVRHIRFVPSIEYLGLEITFDEMLEVFRNFNRGVAFGVDRPAEESPRVQGPAVKEVSEG